MTNLGDIKLQGIFHQLQDMELQKILCILLISVIKIILVLFLIGCQDILQKMHMDYMNLMEHLAMNIQIQEKWNTKGGELEFLTMDVMKLNHF